MSAPRVDWTAGNTFSSAIDQWFQALWVLWIYQIDQSRVDPSTCFDGIQAANDEVELHIVVIIFILDLSIVSAVVLSFK